MSRDPEILHDEICSRLDTIIRLLEKKDNEPHWVGCIPPYEAPTHTSVCCCGGRVGTSGICSECGLPKATPT